MTPIETKENKEEILREFNALKQIFGGLLLESNNNASAEDIAYYQRKFKEAQQMIRR